MTYARRLIWARKRLRNWESEERRLINEDVD